MPDDAPLGIMHPSIMKIRLRAEKYDNRFFPFLLEGVMQKYNAEAKGTGVKMAVTASVLGEKLLILPPIEIQRRFASFVAQTDKIKSVLLHSLAKLELNYNSLMQKSFRGEIF